MLRLPLPDRAKRRRGSHPRPSSSRGPRETALGRRTARCWRAGRGWGRAGAVVLRGARETGQLGPRGRCGDRPQFPGSASWEGSAACPGPGFGGPRSQGSLRDLGRKRRGGLGSLKSRPGPSAHRRSLSVLADRPDGAPRAVLQRPSGNLPQASRGLGASRGALLLGQGLHSPEMGKVELPVGEYRAPRSWWCRCGRDGRWSPRKRSRP